MSFTSNLNDIITQNSNGLLGMHKSWRRVNLSKIATIQNGFPFESSRFSKSEGTPLIRIRDITRGETATFYQGEFDASFLVQAGEILVGMDGDFHCAPWTGIPALLNQRVCKIIPDESQYLKSFLRYVLPGYLAAINAHTNSVTVKHLSSRTVADIPLPLPPLDEQRRIVAEIEKQFTRLDTGVAALQRVQSKLKRYRASVLKSACEGRLVPTESELARAEGRDYESAKVLLQRILTERREKWDGRGKYKEPAAPDIANLPELPDGWVWTNIEQLMFLLRNGISTKPNATEGLPILRISSVRPMSVDMKEIRFLEASAADLSGYVLDEGDLLFTRYNGNPDYVGVCGAVPTQSTPLVHPDKLIRCKLISKMVHPRFVAIMANAGASRSYMSKRIRTTAGQSGISGTDVKGLPIPLPPLAEQERIVEEVERRLSVVDELEATVTANLRRATRLRQSILQQAFSGRLKRRT